MYEDEGYKLMGAAFEVYNQLGYGMAEDVYQQSLESELELRSIPFVAKQPLILVYKGRPIKTHYEPDFFVFGAIIVEIKATKELISEHEAQRFNYMRIARQPVGYLINFGCKKQLDWKRFILGDLHTPGQKTGEH
jgi:GxxExxY protein